MPKCFSRPRIYAAFAALASGGALWEWIDHGPAAGHEPGFLVAMSVAIACMVNHENARRSHLHRQMIEMAVDGMKVYGAGVRDARSCSSCTVWQSGPPDERMNRHLELVQLN